MVAAAELSGFGQGGIKVAAPRGRVLARTQTFGLRRVQNSLNPPSHARSGFWFDLPNRSQTSENACGVHPINRKMPDWAAIGLDRFAPLLTMLGVRNPLSYSVKESKRIGAECRNAGSRLLGLAT